MKEHKTRQARPYHLLVPQEGGYNFTDLLVDRARSSVQGYVRPSVDTELAAIIANLKRIQMRIAKARQASDGHQVAVLGKLIERSHDAIQIALARADRRDHPERYDLPPHKIEAPQGGILFHQGRSQAQWPTRSTSKPRFSLT